MNDIVIQSIVTIVSTFYGFAAVKSSVTKLMGNKVDVVIYQAKVRELHDEINTLRTKVAILEERNANR